MAAESRKREVNASLDYVVPGLLEMAGQVASASVTDQEEPSSPLSVARCIRNLNLKAALEVGVQMLLWL